MSHNVPWQDRNSHSRDTCASRKKGLPGPGADRLAEPRDSLAVPRDTVDPELSHTAALRSRRHVDTIASGMCVFREAACDAGDAGRT